MEYNVIKSGSTGNCVIYHNSIAIDMGVAYSLIKPFVKELKIVLLTHEHQDHLKLKTLQRLQMERPTLRIGCGAWMLPHLGNLKNIDVYEFGKWYEYGDFKLSIGKLYHDVENCFYRIEKNGYKIFHATDTAHLDGITAKGYDLYAIEHNYDEETAERIIAEKTAKGEFCHLRGSINSHLSEQQAKAFLFKNKAEYSQVVRLHETKSYLLFTI